METISGNTANGVPFVARKAATSGAPLISAWHLMDPPNTPAAMAAALPLADLDANVVYFALPMFGERSTFKDFEDMLRSGVDLVTGYFGPLFDQALDEYPEAIGEIRERLGVSKLAKVGFFGGSAGSAVAAGATMRFGSSACVLVSPMLQLRPMIDATNEFMPSPYVWDAESDAIAANMDFIARASEFAPAKVLLIDGTADEPAFLEPAREFDKLDLGEVVFVEGVEHPLAEFPGNEPAPQIEAAITYDRLATAFFKKSFDS
ncbi:MAG: hypothetical protein KF867_05535 [Cryobacterium sp.]|nr:hypothetical protein [Cryobacterium sp.]MBX3104421.1 hypothetical protein [Cryobacterium sp.]